MCNKGWWTVLEPAEIVFPRNYLAQKLYFRFRYRSSFALNQVPITWDVKERKSSTINMSDMLFFFFFFRAGQETSTLIFLSFPSVSLPQVKNLCECFNSCSPLFVFVSRHKRVFDIKWLYAELYQLTWWSNLLLFRRIPNWSKGPNRLCSWVVHSPFHIDVTQGSDGRVAERLGPRAWNSVILGSSPIELFSSLAAVRQLFTSLARHASGQLVDFTLVGSPVSFLLNKSC